MEGKASTPSPGLEGSVARWYYKPLIQGHGLMGGCLSQMGSGARHTPCSKEDLAALTQLLGRQRGQGCPATAGRPTGNQLGLEGPSDPATLMEHTSHILLRTWPRQSLCWQPTSKKTRPGGCLLEGTSWEKGTSSV